MKLNLLVHSVKGLGRGRGFQVTSIKSIIADPEYLQVRQQLAARMIELLGLLVRDGTISNNHIVNQLGIADDTKAKLAMMEEGRRVQSLNFMVLTKELEESRAKNAQLEEMMRSQSLTLRVLSKEFEASSARNTRMEEEKKAQSTNLSLRKQSGDIMTKISWLEEKNRNLEARISSIEDEKRELEAENAAIEGKVDHLLLIAGLRPSQYRDLDAMFEALVEELLAVRALRE